MTDRAFVSRSLLAFLVVLGVASTVAAQSTAPARKTMTAVRAESHERIAIDGRLDEGIWERAIPAGDFMQIDPANGTPATEKTEVRIVYTEDALYMGVICYDSEPDKWLGYQRRRDEFLSSDDRFMWTIDTFLDEQSGYFFEMNPSGLMGDSLFGGGVDNRQWDGIWNAHVERSSIGWTIEIELPFRSLNFNPANDAWGVNFQRTVRRKNEDSIWTGWARNQGLRRMTNAGRVTGIHDVTQGLGLDLKPYGLVSSEASPGRPGREKFNTDPDAGLDLFYSPTPGLRAVLTINTDFAQTEVDQRQVNLTRFSLFFPEKRDFFLDGAPFLAFGSPLSGDLIVNPFFSRRIGLSPAGEPQPITFGTKLTGQLGKQDIGLLHVRTGNDDTAGQRSEDFSVARIRRRVLAQSSVGAIYTRRDTRDGGDDTQQTAGLDMRLATSRFRGNQNLETTAYYLAASSPQADAAHAYGFSASTPNDPWSFSFAARNVDDDFAPGIGFVTRDGYRRYQPGGEFNPRPRGHKYIRRFLFSAYGDVQTNLDNGLLGRGLELKPIDVQFHSGDSFAFQINRDREVLDAAFRVNMRPGQSVTLPVGADYRGTKWSARWQTANRRVLAFNGVYEDGAYYSGTKQRLSLNLTLRARPGLIVYSTAEWNEIDLPQAKFRTSLYRLVGEAQFSPWMALVNNIQYDTVSAVIGWQSRFRWIVRPGSDIYVVYTHNWQDDPLNHRFATLDRRVASKVLYTHRF